MRSDASVKISNITKGESMTYTVRMPKSSMIETAQISIFEEDEE